MALKELMWPLKCFKNMPPHSPSQLLGWQSAEVPQHFFFIVFFFSTIYMCGKITSLLRINSSAAEPKIVQLTLVISTWVILNNYLSRRENLALV